MNKKIISIIMAASMMTSITALAENVTEPLVTSNTAPVTIGIETFKFTGKVTAISESRITVEIANESEIASYSFVLAEGLELGDIKVDDEVAVTTTSPLETKDIKEAVAVEKVVGGADEETDVVVADVASAYQNHTGKVAAVANDSITITIDENDYSFRVSEKTPMYTRSGEEVKEVKAGDSVTVVSTSPLMTKDIKSAAAVIVENGDEESSFFVGEFALENDALISADGELILNVENAKDYSGKTLLAFYNFATLSLPAQTNPTKVVVLEEKVSVSFKVGDSVLNINGVNTEVEKPYVVGTGVTLVPIRVISEAFGAEVIWDGETKTVTVIDGTTTVVIQIDNKTATVNGEEKTLEGAPELTEAGFTMIPLRFISENLGATVSYDDATAAISVER